jgi:hypothetical protein
MSQPTKRSSHIWRSLSLLCSGFPISVLLAIAVGTLNRLGSSCSPSPRLPVPTASESRHNKHPVEVASPHENFTADLGRRDVDRLNKLSTTQSAGMLRNKKPNDRVLLAGIYPPCPQAIEGSHHSTAASCGSHWRSRPPLRLTKEMEHESCRDTRRSEPGLPGSVQYSQSPFRRC